MLFTVEAWSLLISSVHGAEEALESLVDGVWGELLVLLLSWSLRWSVPGKLWSWGVVLADDGGRVGGRCVRQLAGASDLSVSQNDWSDDWARLFLGKDTLFDFLEWKSWGRIFRFHISEGTI